MSKVVILANTSRTLAGWTEVLQKLASAGHTVMDPGCRDFDENETAALLTDADAVLVGLNRLDSSVIAQTRRLKVISKPGVGVDNVDVEAATDAGIVVCNTPGSNADAVADHTIGLMIAVARNLVGLNEMVHTGKGWESWPFTGQQLAGRRIAVIGTGNIGRAVIKRAVAGFGMIALAYDLRQDAELVNTYGVRYGALDEILPLADFVSVHVPLTPATHHLIGARELSMLMPSAIVVNTSRGQVVDEAALANALRNGAIAGAGVDVFDREPCTRSQLFGLRNVVLTPHVAGFSPEASLRSRIMAAENIVNALAGCPRNVVNRLVLSSARLRILKGS